MNSDFRAGVSRLRHRVRQHLDGRRLERFIADELPDKLAVASQRLQSRLRARVLRVALVKQDCNEDLYCCAPGAAPWDTVSTTLLRSGPVDLFTRFDTQFLVLKTEPDPECNIWREKWDALRWAPAAWFEAYRDRIPGRDHGQSRFARPADDIDWRAYDLVVSVDVSVPARITREFPAVVWAYYVRELKMPSWQASLEKPLHGQDLFLSQLFEPFQEPAASHVLGFPYHFQHVGLFHQLVRRDETLVQQPRRGVFVEHHSAQHLTDGMLKELQAFGPVYARRTGDVSRDTDTGETIPDRTMAEPALSALLQCKYHVKWAGRPAFGTAKVEAVAAGGLSITNPALDGTPFLHSAASRVDGFTTLIAQMHKLEADDALYNSELLRQRQLIDYLCHYRPANELLDACDRVRSMKTKGAMP